MQLRFYHSPDTDLPHIYDHSVSESEVEDILRHPLEEAKQAEEVGLQLDKRAVGAI